MTVYVLLANNVYSYEPGEVLGVFASERDAMYYADHWMETAGKTLSGPNVCYEMHVVESHITPVKG